MTASNASANALLLASAPTTFPRGSDWTVHAGHAGRSRGGRVADRRHCHSDWSAQRIVRQWSSGDIGSRAHCTIVAARCAHRRLITPFQPRRSHMRMRIVVADRSEARFYDMVSFTGALQPAGTLTDAKARL